MLALRSEQWIQFCESTSDVPKFSGDYWIKIKKISSQTTMPPKQNVIPNLYYENQVISTSSMKAQTFGKTLSHIFSESTENTNFDCSHKAMVEKHLNLHMDNLFSTSTENSDLDDQFTIAELNECINISNRKSAPGSDCVKNIQLYHLPDCGKELLLKIVNSSLNNNEILDIWIYSSCTMIQKNTTEKSNPSNYRPISLTNSIIKIIERLVKRRLDKFNLHNNSISIFQSGFQKNRTTVDNHLYFTEKFYQAQAINKNNKVCGVIFDISKAFDKVWQQGLIFKLHKLNLPLKLG